MRRYPFPMLAHLIFFELYHRFTLCVRVSAPMSTYFKDDSGPPVDGAAGAT